MKDAASHSATEPKGIAHTVSSRKKENGISFSAPVVHNNTIFSDVIQAKLEEGLTYKALQQVSAFTAPDGLVTQNIASDSLVTALEHRDAENMTKVFDRTATAEKFTPQLPDDSANFTSIGPKLADHHDALIKANPNHVEFKDYRNNNLQQSGFEDPNLISQGEVGDCWFLATLASMVISDHWRQHLINSITKIAFSNDFEVVLHETPVGALDDGTRRVRISGHLMQYNPDTSGFDRQLVFAQLRTTKVTAPGVPPNANAVMWPAFFEKALATIKGSYQAIDDSTPDLAFKALTGSTPVSLLPRTANVDNDGWTTLRNSFNAGAAVTLTTAKNTDLGMADQLSVDTEHVDASTLNLIEDHVYIMVASYQNGNIRLRNPHGTAHPNNLNRANLNKYFERVDYLAVPPPVVPMDE